MKPDKADKAVMWIGLPLAFASFNTEGDASYWFAAATALVVLVWCVHTWRWTRRIQREMAASSLVLDALMRDIRKDRDEE